MNIILHWQQWFTLTAFVFVLMAHAFKKDFLEAGFGVILLVLGQYILYSGGWYTGGVLP